MADLYWVGGSATWDNTAGTKWATTSGGGGGAAIPTVADDVHFDANSAGATVTLPLTATYTPVCRSIDCTGWTGSFSANASGSSINIGDGTAGQGSIALKYVAGMAAGTNPTVITWNFISTSGTQQTIASGGKTMGNYNFNGAGSSYLISDNHAFGTDSFSVVQGTVDMNGKTFSGGSFISSGALARTWTFGAATLNPTVNVTFSGSNLTLNAGSETWNMLTARQFTGNGGSFGTLIIGAGTGQSAGQILDSNTFANLTLPNSAATNNFVYLKSGTNQTVTGTFTANGNSVTNRGFLLTATPGSQATITAAIVSISNYDFIDIVGAGAGNWTVGTSMGNGGNNSGITFTTPVTRYKVGGTGSYSSTSMWSASTGGGSGASVPLCHDTIYVDANSGAGTFTFDLPRIGTIDWTNAATATYSASVTSANGGYSYFGSIVLNNSVGGAMNGIDTYFRGNASRTLTTNGKAFGRLANIYMSGGTFTQADTWTTGEWNLNYATTYTVVSSDVVTVGVGSGGFAIAGSPTLNMGSGNWIAQNPAAGSKWNISGTPTINPQTSTLYLNMTGANTITVGGAGVNWSLYNLKADTSTWTGQLTLSIGGTATILNAIQLLGGAAKTINIQASRTLLLTLPTGLPAGTAGNLITYNTGGAACTISCAQRISIDYVSLTSCAGADARGIPFYAGTHSTDGGGNANWIFTAPPGPTSTSMMMGT